MIDVYEVNGGVSKKLEWEGIINPAVAQLAGYEIIEKYPKIFYNLYIIRRKTY